MVLYCAVLYCARFAQRVSLIKNRATINEGLDPEQIIRRLKTEVLSLREEIAFLKGEAGQGDVLSPAEAAQLGESVRTYVEDPDPCCLLNIGELTVTKIKDTYAVFKSLVLEARRGTGTGGLSMGGGGGGVVSEEMDSLLKQLKDCKSCLLQRDNEISILVNMVKKSKANGNGSGGGGGGGGGGGDHFSEEDQMAFAQAKQAVVRGGGGGASHKLHQQQQQQLPPPDLREQRMEKLIKRHLFGVPPPDDKEIFDDMSSE